MEIPKRRNNDKTATVTSPPSPPHPKNKKTEKGYQDLDKTDTGFRQSQVEAIRNKNEQKLNPRFTSLKTNENNNNNNNNNNTSFQR